MNQPLEEVYQDIASHIVQAIDDHWSAAWITVEVLEEDLFSLHGFYNTLESKTNTFKIHPLVPHLFMEIRRQISDDGTEPWINARFDLHPDGNFNLHFVY